MSEIYEVTVWDHEGNIVEKLWSATEDEAAEMQEKYEDDPLFTVAVGHPASIF